MQLDAAIGAAALLELQRIEWVVFSVVVSELADHVTNRDGDACKARWRALLFSDIDDVNVDIVHQVLVLSDVQLVLKYQVLVLIVAVATRCAAGRRWPTPE